MSEQWRKGLLAAGWTTRAAVELALDVERTAQRLYRELAARWEHDPVLRRLFAYVAAEEAGHEADLVKLRDGLGPERSEAELRGDALAAIARAAFFSPDAGLLADVERASGPVQVLQLLLRFENGTAMYYRGLRDVLGRSAILDAMIAEEQQHAATVRRALEAFGVYQRPLP